MWENQPYKTFEKFSFLNNDSCFWLSIFFPCISRQILLISFKWGYFAHYCSTFTVVWCIVQWKKRLSALKNGVLLLQEQTIHKRLVWKKKQSPEYRKKSDICFIKSNCRNLWWNYDSAMTKMLQSGFYYYGL